MGLLFWVTGVEEPARKRAIAFFDGQNLYRHAMEAYGYHHPNYDPKKLFQHVCDLKSWTNCGVRFYTGTPSSEKSPMWHKYWSNRLLALRRSGVLVESRPIRYRKTELPLPDGTLQTVDMPQEKGIDIRIALDVIRMSISNDLDVAVIFSQDQDLAEVVKEVKQIAKIQNRWIWVASPYPAGGNATVSRGINGAEWIAIEKAEYDLCLDPKDYR